MELPTRRDKHVSIETSPSNSHRTEREAISEVTTNDLARQTKARFMRAIKVSLENTKLEISFADRSPVLE
ncbi:hypothetical protein BFJ63_vAg5316 [Fusarium oxysporum f. sp. narcissi]|uniref:Uncharacterized protein n=2 Tax=Fusarium oxysporum TaxID=5507 RepID=A0A4Q2VYF2_FUSOX|nr:hypothetical protein BFJ65_g13432 [Fusarium oxysporum f. sp. cepae]RKK45568.1 hypothetical protein BFJ66_g9011 [Fusarium oxysporum f. sp. cepae]RKK53288.1 hypothetical protein BFJ67_g5211 [Fusarium oxysporum f. sp. cepae]RKL42064.1 hypothetical protein BFJ70_g4807 [Fusarium oxysporum]RYC91875.1 hypothetical protein BFJ63_vAg5316 [Fusarium oxysporum f. sp. narcissi]